MCRFLRFLLHPVVHVSYDPMRLTFFPFVDFVASRSVQCERRCVCADRVGRGEQALAQRGRVGGRSAAAAAAAAHAAAPRAAAVRTPSAFPFAIWVRAQFAPSRARSQCKRFPLIFSPRPPVRPPDPAFARAAPRRRSRRRRPGRRRCRRRTPPTSSKCRRADVSTAPSARRGGRGPRSAVRAAASTPLQT